MATWRTYAGLIENIAAWSGRTTDTEFIAQIPGFVELCEDEMSQRLRSIYQLRTATAVINEEMEWLPSELRELIHVSLFYQGNALGEMSPASPFQFDQFRKEVVSPGPPRFYQTMGQNIRFWPIPLAYTDEQVTANDVYEFQVYFFGRVPYLNKAAYPNGPILQTSAVIENYPQLYQFGTMYQAALFEKDQGNMDFYGQRFLDAVAPINQEAERLMYPSGMAVRRSGFGN